MKYKPQERKLKKKSLILENMYTGEGKIFKPLDGRSVQSKLYCSLDETYESCAEKHRLTEDDMKLYDSVCSTEGGTSLCSGADELTSLFSTPQFKCEVGSKDCVIVSEKEKAFVYKLIIDYYGGDFMFHKMIKDNETHSIYIAKASTGLIKGDRYLLLTVPRDRKQLGSSTPLSSLRWDSFQSRKLKTQYNIRPFEMRLNIAEVPEMKSKIVLDSRDDYCTQYSCNKLPLLVTLLHKKVGEKYQYDDSGTVELALATFDCILVFG